MKPLPKDAIEVRVKDANGRTGMVVAQGGSAVQVLWDNEVDHKGRPKETVVDRASLEAL